MRNTTAVNMLKAYAARVDPPRREELHAAVARTVNETFLGTLMRQFRSSCNDRNIFAGGRAGMTFTRQLDQHLISELAGSDRLALGNIIADQWLGLKNDKLTEVDQKV